MLISVVLPRLTPASLRVRVRGYSSAKATIRLSYPRRCVRTLFKPLLGVYDEGNGSIG